MRLYTYYRSTAAYRVRIALALKGQDYDPVFINLLKGEQQGEAYRQVNPQGLVPALVTDDGVLLTQSLAIIEYLDEACPQQPLLPADAVGRARVRALAQVLAADTAPLNNLRVQRFLAGELGVADEAKSRWIKHWVGLGLTAFEALLGGDEPGGEPSGGNFCHGYSPGVADCVLLPQVYSAKRFDCPMDAYPKINRIVAACEKLPAFRAAHPDAQADRPA